MAIQNAMNLIRDVKNDVDLRYNLHTIHQSDVEMFLEEQGYKFTYQEFEEAINMMHVKCQTHEEADELMQVVMWLKLLFTVYN
jgi:predicted ribosomally synthesized peptide with nif11-like leader